jgi:hypothetical protein
MTTPTNLPTEQQLRARIAELEAELAEQAARTEAAIAAAQRSSFWPDLLQLDFDAIMAHPVLRFAVLVPLKIRGAGRRLRWYWQRARGG